MNSYTQINFLNKRTGWVLCSLFAFCGFFALSCSMQANAEAHTRHLSNPENGLRQTQTGEWFEYQLQYQTADVLAAQSLKAEGLPQSDLPKLRQDYEGHHYLLFCLKPVQKNHSVQETLGLACESPEQAEDLWKTLQFGLQPYVKLSCGTDTLPCVLYHAQPPLFKNSEVQINLVFLREPDQNKDNQEDLVLSIHIPAFPERIPSFRIKRSDLTQIPTSNL